MTIVVAVAQLCISRSQYQPAHVVAWPRASSQYLDKRNAIIPDYLFDTMTSWPIPLCGQLLCVWQCGIWASIIISLTMCMTYQWLAMCISPKCVAGYCVASRQWPMCVAIIGIIVNTMAVSAILLWSAVANNTATSNEIQWPTSCGPMQWHLAPINVSYLILAMQKISSVSIGPAQQLASAQLFNAVSQPAAAVSWQYHGRHQPTASAICVMTSVASCRRQ